MRCGFVKHFSIGFYPSQTQILEGLTKEEIRLFEALFKGVSIWVSSFVNPSKIFV
jgi:hypothetical protein